MKSFDRYLSICVAICALIYLGCFCRKQTDGFTIRAISSNRPFHPEFATRKSTLEEEHQLTKALSQSYTYFGCGGQAYAFFSEDGQFVIKFFKQRLFKKPWLLNHFPLPKFLHRYRFKRNWKREDKLFRDFSSYKTALEQLQDQTALIYCHLNKTSHLHTLLPITDRLGIRHLIDLDHFDFIVQKRAVKIHDHITQLVEHNHVEQAKEAIGQVLTLISHRAKKGYRDRDPNISTNCGFLGDKAIKIDVGRFVKNEEMKTKESHNQELLQICAPFKKWLKDTHPFLLSHYQKQLEETLIK